MKKLILLFSLIGLYIICQAQSPEGFNYQGVARDNNDSILRNQNIGLRISILQDSTSGTVAYSERHTPTSNGYGVFELIVGNGTILSGNFATIDWGANSHFVKVEMDGTGGTNYQLMGVSQLLSVPYALHAKTAANGFSGNYNDLTNTPTNVSQFINDAGFITNPNDADHDSTNEIQALSISNDTIFLSNGGFVKLPAQAITTVFKDNEFAIINAASTANSPASPPNAALAGVGAGSVDNGTHSYKVTFVTSTGETTPSTVSDSVTVIFNGSNGKIAVTNIPVSSDVGVTARKLYRRFHPTGPDYKYVATINDNITTVYTDNIPYSSLGGIAPASNNTQTQFQLNASQLTQNRTYSMPDKSGTITVGLELPIGSVFAWLKNLPGVPTLPDGWVECNGQVLNDIESPLNGSIVPNLNGSGDTTQMFLRGATASGGTGGEDTHTLSVNEIPNHSHNTPAHSHTFSIYGNNAGTQGAIARSDLSGNGISFTTGADGAGTASSTGGDQSHENRPPFYEVVWIIRVK